ncbi:MAG: two-component regulator propeller domain-containing protein [Pseudomonadota bacterium]
MRFEQLSLRDGLSQVAVVTMLQDADGFLWFGTENGLNRYDGYEFVHYKADRGNPDALRNDFIYSLAEAPDGAIWVSTKGGGVARFDKKAGTFQSFRHDPDDARTLSGDNVRTLLVDSDGAVWAGVRNGGLNRIDTSGDVQRFPLIEGRTASVHALYEASDGSLWVGADEGLFRIDRDSGDTQAYRHDSRNPNTLSSDRIRSILVDRQGTLWVGTLDGGLNRLDSESGDFSHFRNSESAQSLSSDRVTSILEDRDGRLWIGTSRGLNLHIGGTDRFVRFNHDASDRGSLSNDAISSMLQDRSGLLWIGTLAAGVNKWNPRSWALGLQESEQIAASADAKPIVTALTTSEDTLWIGTFGEGLVARDRSSDALTHYRHNPDNPRSISDDRVMSVLRASNGAIWAGTMRGGLNRLNPETGAATTYRNDPNDDTSLSANGVMTVFEDSEQTIWVGTFGGGISVYNSATDSFSRIGVANDVQPGLSSPRVTAFAEDSHGNLWIGTDGGGLNLYMRDSGLVYAYRFDQNDPRSLSSDTIYSLHVDSLDRVWVGTRDAGLDRVVGSSVRPDAIRFTNVDQNDGLSNDVVNGIQSDASGRLWLSTNYGITQVDPSTGTFRQLHRDDGLQGEEFNFGAHHRSDDGTLFFGGLQGYNEFKPERLPASAAIPPVVLTGFFLGGGGKQPVPDTGVLDLDYQDDNISFEFAALDFASPQNNRYQYKLEGFDKDWIDLGNRRRVTYTDLDDGAYVLRVKGASADGVWNHAGVALPITVAPAPWLSWWAYLGYVAAAVQVCLFLWLGHRRKIRREEEYSERLEREVNERTNELAQRSEELAMLNESLHQSSLSDPLTGLRNRRFVIEEISKDLQRAVRNRADLETGIDITNAADLVFMVIDLDNFKPINDTYGHAAGDQVLLEIRDVLLSTCRRSDHVVRWGGDEFVVVAKQSRPGEAQALAERIRSHIERSDFVLEDGQIVRTTCSIGFVAFPLFTGHAEKATLDEVINMADDLMYEAKRQRNAWVGLLDIDEAAASRGFNSDDIEPTSVLFRARHTGRLQIGTGKFPLADEQGSGA